MMSGAAAIAGGLVGASVAAAGSVALAMAAGGNAEGVAVPAADTLGGVGVAADWAVGVGAADTRQALTASQSAVTAVRKPNRCGRRRDTAASLLDSETRGNSTEDC